MRAIVPLFGSKWISFSYSPDDEHFWSFCRVPHNEIKCHRCQYRSSVMQLPEMNVGKASPTLHDVSIWSATTEEEFHFQQLKRVKQVPQVQVNAVFPHGLAAAMLSKRRQDTSSKWTTKQRTWRKLIWNSGGSRFLNSHLAQVRSAKPKSQSRFKTSSGTQRISIRLGPQIQA